MKKIIFFSISFFCSFLHAQEQDTIHATAQDSSVLYSIELKEIIVSKDGVSTMDEEKKKLLILKRRVYKTYPYAKLTAEKLLQINATMVKLKTDKERKKYFKIVENYLQEEFEPKLKKMSRKDGQILVKLIYRQTGQSTFNLIKDYKSGWKAFWSNNTAKLFDINIKDEYKPFDRVEDYQIESILVIAFRQGQLENQPSVKPIDLSQLSANWKEKLEKMKEERLSKTTN